MAFIAPVLAAVGAAAASTGGAVALASTAVSVLGTGASALASANAASYQADLAKVQGRQAQEQAGVRAGEVARNTRQTLAAARAGALQNGFELSGSMNDLFDQTGRQGQLDYLTAVYDGSVQAAGANASARLYRNQAKNAIIGGVLGAGAQALGGVSNVYRSRTAKLAVSGT